MNTYHGLVWLYNRLDPLYYKTLETVHVSICTSLNKILIFYCGQQWLASNKGSEPKRGEDVGGGEVEGRAKTNLSKNQVFAKI